MDKFYKCVLLALTALLTLAGGHRSGLAANNDANAAFAQPAGPEQAVTVRGIVKDGNGPVIGASVIEKGTTNGTATDAVGEFQLQTNPGATITVSYLGYKTAEIPVGNRTYLEITLDEDSQVLNEVVVTALGIKRERKALGYGVDEVKGEVLTKAKETNVINSLAGRVPGLVVSQTAGGPSGSTRVILRGSTEMTGNNTSEQHKCHS